jgi:hypothetical protein
LLGSRSAKKAAKQRAAAYNEAGSIVGGAYDEAGNLLEPRAQQEQGAMARVNTLLGLPGGDGSDPTAVLRSTPGYQFALDQGAQVRERSAAARGGLNSGNTLAALEEYGQGFADQGFQQYLQNVLGLQNQGADAGLASLRVDRGNSLADLRLGAGGARAAGTEGRAAAWSGALSGVAGVAGNRMNPLAGGRWRTPGIAG